MKNYSKIFKWMMIVLIVLSAALCVYGFSVGFESNGAAPVDLLFYWTYVMIAIAAVAVIIVGVAIAAKNNPKSLVKMLIGLVAIAAICFVVYLISPGSPAVGLTTEQPAQSQLRLTDTILNLTYLTSAVAIIAIIVGEIIVSVRNRQ